MELYLLHGERGFTATVKTRPLRKEKYTDWLDEYSLREKLTPKALKLIGEQK